jgi:hypothetical protein
MDSLRHRFAGGTVRPVSPADARNPARPGWDSIHNTDQLRHGRSARRRPDNEEDDLRRTCRSGHLAGSGRSRPGCECLHVPVPARSERRGQQLMMAAPAASGGRQADGGRDDRDTSDHSDSPGRRGARLRLGGAEPGRQDRRIDQTASDVTAQGNAQTCRHER